MGEARGVKVTGLVHWAIPADDLEESRRFYTEILGMDDQGTVGPTMRCVQFADTKVLLCRRQEPPPGGFREHIHLAFQVSPEDFERAVTHLRDWGVDVQRPTGGPEHIRGDVEYRREGVFVGRSLYFNDPAGNRLELHQPGFPPEP